jgi:short subunit dehydrogenase-like uncharacterized protein
LHRSSRNDHLERPRQIAQKVSHFDESKCLIVSMLIHFLFSLSSSFFFFHSGGVFTPAAAFSNTRLIERLEKHNILFEVVDPSTVSGGE